MPEHDPPRSQERAARMRADAADKAARDEAGRVVERWNRHIAADKEQRPWPACRGLRCIAPAARRLAPSISVALTATRSRRSAPGTLSALYVVSRLGTDAGDQGLARIAARRAALDFGAGVR
jgi:hypothetical protein